MFKKNFNSIFKSLIVIVFLTFLFLLLRVPGFFFFQNEKSFISRRSFVKERFYLRPIGEERPPEQKGKEVWSFLLDTTSKANLPNTLDRNKYPNWLSVIQKMKIFKSANYIRRNNDNKVIFAILEPLWYVDPKTPYEALPRVAEKVLIKLNYRKTDIKEGQYEELMLNTYKKEKNKLEGRGKDSSENAAYQIIETLKENNRWKKLQEYRIPKIGDVDITPFFSLLKIKNMFEEEYIDNLSATKKSYDELKIDVQNTLLYLLDLHYSSLDDFKEKGQISQILDTLAKLIDKEIQKISEMWSFLEKKERFTALRYYKVSKIGDILLRKIKDTNDRHIYKELPEELRAALYKLANLDDYKNVIDETIKDTIAKASAVWDFLQKENRLQDLKDYKISQIDDIKIRDLEEINVNTEYQELIISFKKTLYKISELDDYKNKIINTINAVAVWSFLQKENRLQDLKDYKIAQIEGLQFKGLKDVTFSSSYDELSKDLKDTLYSLSQLDSYESKIKNLITKIKKNAAAVWSFFQNQNLLQYFQNYQITQILGLQLKGLKDVPFSSSYDELPKDLKNTLYSLSQLDSYESAINDLIIKNKEKTLAVWTFLQKENRLEDLQFYKISFIGIVNIEVFKTLKVDSEYDALSPLSKRTFFKISQLYKYEDVINQVINDNQDEAVSVWRFLQKTENFQKNNFDVLDKNAEIYSSWLEVIQKMKILKGVKDKFNEPIIFKPLWEIENQTPYIKLSDEVKEMLTKISQLAHEDGRDYRYQDFITDTYEKEYLKINGITEENEGWFYKNAAYQIIRTLKEQNRWKNLQKYNIKNINDIDISSLLEVKNIDEILGFKDSYESLSADVRETLLYLLDLDYEKLSDFRSEDEIDKILTALAQRIDEKILITQVTLLWTELQKEDRIQNLKDYAIEDIYEHSITNLINAGITKNYDDLSPDIQEELKSFIPKSFSLIIKIDEIINDKINKTTVFWNWLQKTNRLADLQEYNIQEIKEISISHLLTFKKTSLYVAFPAEIKKELILLLKIPDPLASIDQVIFDHKSAEAKLLWIEWQKNNQIKNLKDCEIYNIQGSPINHLVNADIKKDYDDLSSDIQKEIIFLLKVKNLINVLNEVILASKNTKANTLWRKFLNKDWIKNFKLYKINAINENPIINLLKADIRQDYDALNNDMKKELISLAFETNIIDSIYKTIIKSKNNKIQMFWNAFKEENRIQNLQTYKITSIDGLSVLRSLRIAFTDKYLQLDQKVQNELIALSLKEDIIAKIDIAIKNAQKEATLKVQDLFTNLKGKQSILKRLRNLKQEEIILNEEKISLKALLEIENWKAVQTLSDLSAPAQAELMKISQTFFKDKGGIKTMNESIDAELNSQISRNKNTWYLRIIISVFSGIILLITLLYGFLFWRQKRK